MLLAAAILSTNTKSEKNKIIICSCLKSSRLGKPLKHCGSSTQQTLFSSSFIVVTYLSTSDVWQHFLFLTIHFRTASLEILTEEDLNGALVAHAPQLVTRPIFKHELSTNTLIVSYLFFKNKEMELKGMCRTRPKWPGPAYCIIVKAPSFFSWTL